MVKFFDRDVYTKEEWLDLMGEHLSGTCMNSVREIFSDEDYLVGINYFEITEDEFEKYLVDQGIYECNSCGWWTYAGEGDGTYCDDCVDDENEEE